MLERIKDVGPSIDGVFATGRVTREDYELVFRPLLDEARRSGRKIRLLYQLGPELQGFTAGAAWDDLRLGLSGLRLFGRCAVVSDNAWVRDSMRWIAVLVPFPMRSFDSRQEALAWLTQPEVAINLGYELLSELGVLTLEVKGPLRKEDFDAISAVVDPWIESRGNLRGIVVRAKQLPQWQDLGSFIRHMRFVRDHHERVERVALAIDGKIPELVPRVAQHFIGAEIKQFPYEQSAAALSWARGHTSDAASTPRVVSAPRGL